MCLGGHADNSVKLISSDGAKAIETAAGHSAPVTCVCLSLDNSYLVTGSRDTTVILWRLRRVSSAQMNHLSDASTASPTTPTSPLTDGSKLNDNLEISFRRRIEGPLHVLRGHLGEIVCCSVSSDLGIVASSSNISGVLIHSLRRGRLIRKLDFVAHAICLSPQGVILIWNKVDKKISTFTINGVPIASTILSPFSGKISCIEISVDGENALIGTSHIVDDPKDSDQPDSCEIGKNNPGIGDDEAHLAGTNENRQTIQVPSICFLNIHTLKVKDLKSKATMTPCTFELLIIIF